MSHSHELLEPITGPLVWHAEGLFSRSDWQPTLTVEDRKLLAAAARNSVASGASIDVASVSQFDVGPLQSRFELVQHNLEHGSGASLIRGLPIDSLSEDEVRHLFFGIASRLGTPISQSAAGELIFSVRDEGFQVGHPKARGPNTRKRLSFHTDRCDVIGFLCLQQAKSGGANQLVSSAAVFNELLCRYPDQLRTLMQPFYYARHNVDTANSRPWCQQPIFSFTQGHFACSYLRVLIDRAYALKETPEMTAEQREALDCLEQVTADPQLHVTFHQQPGDLLLLNNWVTLHRRDEFEDHDDLQLRRHILRIWLSMPNSRPLDPLFVDNYGATAAGALRGGMRAAAHPK